MNARTTVVVVTWRGRAHLTACLDALAAQTRPHRTLVVDNASDDGTADVLARHPSKPEIRRLPVNVGYAGALAAVEPETEFVAWLNDDAAPRPDWLARMEDALDADQGVAAASARLLSPTGEVQSVGVRLTADGHGADAVTGPVFGFCGGAALLRTAALTAVGGVPGDFFCYYEDTDTSWRLRLAGWSIVPVEADVTHLHGASTAPGSAQFHLWNERNRLLTLLRCAPLGVALTQLARFALLTAVLPTRRNVGPEHNFRVGLRLRVLAQVAARLPRTVIARYKIDTDRATRSRVWRHQFASRAT
ncbi:Glycosyltransferase, GT2 family [Actinokineospora alba]|uniref:Glycosyltransferase, GT2 family n=1 Tax=Actinokineospora alba TaxID=504798 RepID=A0A1H0U9S9_9PSEU|nr:glycosyltransferase family 2 protein [Actinokineospora alba]TDP65243.1 GT2 family glycosyltransferase [Actinokineospora alba]SDH57649.1 Glycosyltransferase, GT2 family [Actinokineospora alba]SDP62924.1 Glycosyltransferase, GT2 family [Actinokineospora alba]